MSTYYVRKTGDDSNGGTNATTDAVLTLSRANALVTTDDIIDIGIGTWSEDNQLGAVSYVTYKGAGIEKTIIDGTLYGSTSVRRLLEDMRVHITGYQLDNYIRLKTASRVHLDFTDDGRTFTNAGGIFSLADDVTWNHVVVDGFFTTGSKMFSSTNTGYTLNFNNCVFANNTSFYGMFYWGSDVSVKYRNCIWYNNGFTYFGYGGFAGVTVDSDYNCFYGTELRLNGNPTAITIGDHSFSVDPKFVSPSTGDFHLADDSPLIGQGTAIL